jgi:hypothetical protein
MAYSRAKEHCFAATAPGPILSHLAASFRLCSLDSLLWGLLCSANLHVRLLSCR